MSKQLQLVENIKNLEQSIHYTFKNNALLQEALTHSSMSLGVKNKVNNQRMEFLGNSILGAALADIIYEMFPKANEGELSILHAKLASTIGIVTAVENIDLGRYILFNLGEQKNGGANNPKNIEDCAEAIIAAIYIDGGYDAAKRFVKRFWCNMIENLDDLYLRDSKSRLQEFCQKRGYSIPQYCTIQQHGLMHAPTFTIQCTITIKNKEIHTHASSTTKKNGEQKSAEAMLNKLKQDYSSL